MLKYGGCGLAFVALAGILQLHLLVAQGVAWGGMFADFARSGSVSGALKKTFDGEHPCCLCKKIAQEKKRENAQFPVRLELLKEIKVALRAAAEFTGPLDHGIVGRPTLENFKRAKRFEPPPTPPPRMNAGNSMVLI